MSHTRLIMEYEPLLNSRNEIRLLTLLPNVDTAEKVQCTLRKVSVDDDPYYKALSYCWGDESDVHEIDVNGTEIKVSFMTWFFFTVFNMNRLLVICGWPLNRYAMLRTTSISG